MDEQQAGKLQVKLGPLVFGILFVVLGVSGAADANLNAAWVGAAMLAAAGIAGLLGSVRSVRQDPDR